MPDPEIAAIVLQYGHWQKTAECVDSLLKSSAPPKWIIVVDNASPDDSVVHIMHWLGVNAPGLNVVREEEGDIAAAPVTLLRMRQNRGYAAGNNAGMRLALTFGAQACLLINNDAALEKDALAAMRQRLFASRRPGLCGPLVLYNRPGNPAQCCGGGRTSFATGLSSLIGQGLPPERARALDAALVEAKINFICGACLLASRAFVETVGYMDEGYFLYCEEQDWALRANGRFDLVYAPAAVCLHYEGLSTGWSRYSFQWSPGFRLFRSRLRLAWRHHPQYLPIVAICGAVAAARQFCRRHA